MGHEGTAETGNAMGEGFRLRPYQLEAMAAWWAQRRAGLRRGIINLPTGTGKTVLGLAIAQATPGRVLWLAHRDELIEQPQRTAAVTCPQVRPGVVQASRDEVGAELVFASVATVARPARLQRLLAAGGFALVVVDEAHHAVAETYRRVLAGVGALAPGGPPVLGLTATVERGDRVRLDAVFERVVYHWPLLSAIRAGYLVDLVMRRTWLNVDLDAVRSSGDDWHEGELGEALLQAGVAEATAGAFLTHAGARQALVFCATVEQAQLTAQALQAAGVAAAWLAGTTPLEERRELLRRLRAGTVQVVTNCAVLLEGFDEPSLQAVLIARPTRSKPLYLQMIGRGTRTFPGKQDCLVVDVVGATRRHSLMQAPVLFGLDPRLSDGHRVTQALAAQDQRAARVRGVIAAGEEISELARAAFHWVQAGEGLFALGVGRDHGTLLLVQGPSGWELWQTRRETGPQRITLGSGGGVDLELAQGIAEDLARRLDVAALAGRAAPWRSRPASEASLRALERWGLPAVPEGLTQGEAADRLTAAVARATARRLRQA